MQRFTFNSSPAKSVISDVTSSLLTALYDMSNRTAGHFHQICEDLNGWPITVELPKTWADVEMSGEIFIDHHGVSQREASGMYYPEHTDPYLKSRGCTAIGDVIQYMSNSGYFMHDDADIETMTAAKRRVLEVHLSHIHNIPTDELTKDRDLQALHDTLITEFYAACASRPPRLRPVTN